MLCVKLSDLEKLWLKIIKKHESNQNQRYWSIYQRSRQWCEIDLKDRIRIQDRKIEIELKTSCQNWKKRSNSKDCLPQNFKSCQREHFLFFSWSNFPKVNTLCLGKNVVLSRMSLPDKQSLCQKTTNAHHFWHKNARRVYIFSKHFCNSPFEYQLLHLFIFFQIACLPDLRFLFENKYY